MTPDSTLPPPSQCLPSDAAPRILLVEDDPKIADMVANYLHAQGLQTRLVTDGLQAVAQAREMSPELILLDLMLPGLDGIEVCRAIRAFSDVPIIMVTARVDEIDRLVGLEIGADDYVCKPFSPRELVARVRALLRRSQGTLRARSTPDTLATASPNPLPADQEAPQLKDYPQRQQITFGQTSLSLTPVEYRLLALFLARPGHVFARTKLLDHLHADFRDVSDRAIDSHIKNIRRKLEKVQASSVAITSIYGVGYRLDVEP